MIFGRIVGWSLLFVALVMVSAEAVLALGAEAYQGLSTREIWILLAGVTPDPAVAGEGLERLLNGLMEWPAWALFGILGLLLSVTFRPTSQRQRRRLMARPPHGARRGLL